MSEFADYTVGEFLREKVDNMAAWLKENGCPVDLPQMGNLALTAFAQTLQSDYKVAIGARDFTTLLEDKENLPPQILMTVSFVQKNSLLHDKFWRYLTLFSDTVE